MMLTGLNQKVDSMSLLKRKNSGDILINCINYPEPVLINNVFKPIIIFCKILIYSSLLLIFQFGTAFDYSLERNY